MTNPFLKYIQEHGKAVETNKFKDFEFEIEKHPELEGYILIGVENGVFDTFIYSDGINVIKEKIFEFNVN